jgi:glycogen debranching enzyme
MSELIFPISHTPFSHFGSWLSVSPVVGPHALAGDLHLISHRNGMNPVLSLIPVSDGRRVTRAEIRAGASELTWACGARTVSLAFETADTIRVQGRGLGLEIKAAIFELTSFSGSYLIKDPLDGSYVFTSYETGHRYRVTILSGDIVATGIELLGSGERAVVLSGGDSAEWEAVIEEFATARVPYRSSRTFAEHAEHAERRFQHFARAITAQHSVETPAAQHAAYVLWSATVEPAGFIRRPSILMSKHWMDKVWSWDHCFNALAVAPGVPELAWDQFMTLFDHQDVCGALPDSITHSEVLYNFVKPPVHGWALAELRRRLSSQLTDGQLTEAYGRLRAWTEFWLNLRRAPGRRLCHYHHGNDSGWDNATTFAQNRVIETADLAALLVLQLQCLAQLADELGEVDEAGRWTAEAAAMKQALLEELWDGSSFVARPPDSGIAQTSQSLLELLPIVLGPQLPPMVATQLVERVRTHLATAGLATEPPSSQFYQPNGYWRGPVWAPPTVLIEFGLRSLGQSDLADQVRDRFLRACEQSGFAENFDAMTGDGLRDRAYTWTASAYLLLSADREDEGQVAKK